MQLIVVFDTNVLLSGFGWRGKPYNCLRLAREGRIISVTCEEILEEFAEKLQLKFKNTHEQVNQSLLEVRSFSRTVPIPKLLRACADPDDDMILECAVVAEATHIITGDRRHLLPMETYEGISIVSAADFLTLVAERTTP